MKHGWLMRLLGFRTGPQLPYAATRILSHRESVFVAIAVTNAAKRIRENIERDGYNATLRMGDTYQHTIVADDAHVRMKVTVHFEPINRHPKEKPAMPAPTVTPEQVAAAIASETYTVLPNERTTVCQLTLYNGFTVEGSSACVCKENFDAEKGNLIARREAEGKVWMLLGFMLAEKLHVMGPGFAIDFSPSASAPVPAPIVPEREFLMRAVKEDCRIVSTGQLSNEQISAAHGNDRMHVDPESGMGFVLLPWNVTTLRDAEREAKLAGARMAAAAESRDRHTAKRDS